MVKWAVGVAVVAVILAILAFGGLVGVAAGLLKILFYLAVFIAVVLFILGFTIFKTVT